METATSEWFLENTCKHLCSNLHNMQPCPSIRHSILLSYVSLRPHTHIVQPIAEASTYRHRSREPSRSVAHNGSGAASPILPHRSPQNISHHFLRILRSFDPRDAILAPRPCGNLLFDASITRDFGSLKLLPVEK